MLVFLVFSIHPPSLPLPDCITASSAETVWLQIIIIISFRCETNVGNIGAVRRVYTHTQVS